MSVTPTTIRVNEPTSTQMVQGQCDALALRVTALERENKGLKGRLDLAEKDIEILSEHDATNRTINQVVP